MAKVHQYFRNLIFISLLLQMVIFLNGDMDYTYSASDLFRLIQTDQRISERLEKLADTFSNFSHQLKLLRASNIQLNGLKSNDIIKNPLLSYQLVKRHVKDLEVFDTTFSAFLSKVEEIRNSYTKVRSTFIKPSDKNLDYAMEAIIRLRQTYNLSVDELSQGKLGNAKFDGTLLPEDLARIGMYAKKNGMVTNSKLFLETALNKHNAVKDNDKNGTWIDDALIALTDLKNSNKTKGDREDSRVLTEMDEIFATDSLENLNRAFENLCQMYTVTDPPTSTLKCYLDKFSNPVRQISPLKIEVHHEDPQVVVIYDFMSDKEMTAIEDATFYNLKRSHTQFYLYGTMHTEPSIIRTTSQTWIYDLNHPVFGYLSKRIESVTGYYLSGVHSGEELQVASYRPGGHYSLHTDATQEEVLKEFLSPEDIIQGDRIATFMVYLSDVELGGNTAFPMLNISVQPIKGSAILWGNLYPDGNIARNTLHGACPVVYGVKNIATKWIRANDQMFTKNNCKPDKSSNHFQFFDKY